MATLTLTRRQKAHLADLGGFSRGFWTQIGAAIRDSIVQNIENQQQADGGAIKTNAPSTLAVKRRWGRGSRSLIDKDKRFVRKAVGGWEIAKYLPKGKGIHVGASGAELKKLNQYVQARGYVGWLGINKKSWATIRELVRKEIIRLIKAAERKSK